MILAGLIQVVIRALETWDDYIYNKGVEYEWNHGKSKANIAAGRLGFEAIERFAWEAAIIDTSNREGESRWAAIGPIGNRLYHVVYTARGDRRRIISLRRASRKESMRYVRERA